MTPGRIILSLLWFLTPGLVFAATFVPSPGKTLLLVGQDIDTIAQYVKATGNIPGGTSGYTSIQQLEGLEERADYGSGSQDGNALLKSYPHSAVQIGLYMVDGLNDTIAGKYDAHLKTLAHWIKKANRPVFLRIGYEFDLPMNHYDPTQYKTAFRYVVDFLRKEGVRNAAYVWHSYCAADADKHWMDWYPGDDYVDWYGVSLFATQQIPKAVHFLKLAREHGKPFIICESTPWGIYTVRGKIDFLNHLFQFVKDSGVNAFCYINTNWDAQAMWKGQSIGDARLEAVIQIKNLWLKEVNQRRYVKAVN